MTISVDCNCKRNFERASEVFETPKAYYDDIDRWLKVAIEKGLIEEVQVRV